MLSSKMFQLGFNMSLLESCTRGSPILWTGGGALYEMGTQVLRGHSSCTTHFIETQVHHGSPLHCKRGLFAAWHGEVSRPRVVGTLSPVWICQAGNRFPKVPRPIRKSSGSSHTLDSVGITAWQCCFASGIPGALASSTQASLGRTCEGRLPCMASPALRSMLDGRPRPPCTNSTPAHEAHSDPFRRSEKSSAATCAAILLRPQLELGKNPINSNRIQEEESSRNIPEHPMETRA